MSTGYVSKFGAITIRTRTQNGRSRSVRFIKYRENGPYSAANWMPLARYWWLRNKGPIPPGMRVVHVDGDTMNDAPDGANYALYSAADVIASWHFDHPEESERHFAKLRMAMAEFNRTQGAIRHNRGHFRMNWWYAVSPAAKTIKLRPFKERWQVYAANGAELSASPNGRGWVAAVLGWPGVPSAAAAALCALVDGPCSLVELRRRAAKQIEPYAIDLPRTASGWMIALRPVRSMIRTLRCGRHSATYFLADGVLAMRKPQCSVLAVRGDALNDINSIYRSFQRVDDSAPALEVA